MMYTDAGIGALGKRLVWLDHDVAWCAADHGGAESAEEMVDRGILAVV